MSFDNQHNLNRILNAISKYGFVDTTWGNDAMPSISLHDCNDEPIMRIWVDWLNPERSEFENQRADGSCKIYQVSHGEGSIFETDSVEEIIEYVESYRTVHDLESAKQWLIDLDNAGRLWHMDEDPSDCLRHHYTIGSKVNLWKKVMSRLKINQEAACDVDWEEFEDIHGFCLHLTR